MYEVGILRKMDLLEKKREKEWLSYSFLPLLSHKAQTPLPLSSTSGLTQQQICDVLTLETGIPGYKECLSDKLAQFICTKEINLLGSHYAIWNSQSTICF